MGKYLGVAVMIGACALASACASAPISMVSSALPGHSAETQTQLSLRGATSRLQSVFEERGWIRAAQTLQATTSNWMARLTGQRSDEDVMPTPDPVPYLAQTNFSTMDSAVAVAQLTMDIDEAQDLVRDVDLAAAHLIGREEGVSRESLTRDLELVERAVAHSREALDTFDQAIETVASHADHMSLAQLTTHRDRLAAHSEGLRDRADELADIRMHMRSSSAS